MVEKKRAASTSDLVIYAEYLRDIGYRGIYVFGGGPGIIKWSQQKKQEIVTYCFIGETGRVWLFVFDTGD